MAYEDDRGLYAPNHSICHFMIIFQVLLHNFIRSVLDFVYHQYGIYRMYSGMKFHTFYKSHLSV